MIDDSIEKLRFHETSIEKYINILSITLVFVLFTVYAYLYAGNNNITGGKVLSIIVLISCFRFFFIRYSFNYNFLIVFLSFFYLILLSSLLYPSNYINFEYTKNAIYLLLMSLVIISSFCTPTEVERNSTQLMCLVIFIALSVLSILIEYNILDKKLFDSLNFIKIVKNNWNNKFYSYWLVFLMWSIISNLWKKNILLNILSLVVVILCLWAVFLTDSESAQLALIVSFAYFVILNLKLKKFSAYIYFLPPLFTLILPVMWVILFPIMDLMKQYPLFYNYIAKIDGIYGRIPIYDACAQLIRKKIIIGYGFGSAINLPIDQTICNWGGGILPGGHPHNIVLMSLLEQGIFGYFWLLTTILILFYFAYKTTFKRNDGPAICSMLISALIIFSLSFDVWDADVVMLYVMFLVLLRLSIGKVTDVSIHSKIFSISSKFLVANTMIASIVYLVHFISA